MQPRFAVLLCSIVLMNAACSPRNIESDIQVIDLEGGFSRDGELKLSELVSDVELIQLKGVPEDKYIHHWTHSYFVGEDYILVANGKPMELFLFDRKGDFLRMIGQVGKGPGEFQNCEVHCFDSDEQRILVCDSYGKRLIQYDITGQHILNRGMDYYSASGMNYVSDIICTADNNFVLFNQNPPADSINRLFILDDKLELIETGINEKQIPDNVLFGSRAYTQSFSDYSVVYTPGVDTIYQLKNRSLTPIAQMINIGEGNAKRQYSESDKSFVISKYLFHPKAHIFSLKQGNNTVTLAQRRTDSLSFRFGSEKNCSKVYRGNYGFENDLFAYSPISPNDIRTFNGLWSLLIHPETIGIISEIQGDIFACLEDSQVKYPKVLDHLIKLLRNQGENAAPIIVVMTLAH